MANGRRGKFVFLLKGGPTLSTRIQVGDHGETSEHAWQLYRGVDADGWYWVSPAPILRAYLLNQGVFADLLRVVTGDEFKP